MVDAEYIPELGDLVWIEFSPQAGHEQAGRRPALILTPWEYNRVRGLALMCPITSRARGYPFEVEMDSDCDINGVVMSDQVRSTDWRARYYRYAGKAENHVVSRVLEKLSGLLGLPSPRGRV